MSDTADNDHCSREGAQQLAEKLNAYWHAQGCFMVQHWIEPAKGREPYKRPTRIWVVRSNLVRGQPPKIGT